MQRQKAYNLALIAMSPQQHPYDENEPEEDHDPFDDPRARSGHVSGYDATEAVDLNRLEKSGHAPAAPSHLASSSALSFADRDAAQIHANASEAPGRAQGRTGPPTSAHRAPLVPGRPHDPNIGKELGSYRILSLIGAGGMGQVYEAEHIRLGRRVALKLLRPEYAAKRDAVHRFFGEARAVNAIGHENIVDITDYVEADTGETFFIMELLQGSDLSHFLRKGDGPVPLQRAMNIALQVCDALDAAHHTDIIHRDLKPDNIFVVNDGRREDFVKLLDFGVAKLQGELSSNASYQTAAGSVIGTPAYMSPEQASGLLVDQRTDIYSLGAILYEMFTGHPVFNAKSFGEFVVKHMNDRPIAPRDLADAPKIPMALEAVILRCLEKEPINRYQNVQELRDDLARATATVETAIPRPRLPRPRAIESASRRRPYLPVVIGLGVVLLAGTAFMVAAGIPLLGGGSKRQSAPSGERPVVAAPPATADAELGQAAVSVSIETTPPGAQVAKRGSTTSLGKTPLVIEGKRLGPLGSELVLKLRLDGFREETLRIKVEDAKHQVDLVALPPAIDPASATAASSTSASRKPRAHSRKSRARARAHKARTRKSPKAAPQAVPTLKKRTTKIDNSAQVDPFK